MAQVSAILIAAPELIPALRDRVGADADALTFSDAEPLRAIEAIAAHRPPRILLERLFAASPRGAALIGRIKSDHALDSCQIVIVAHDSDYRRVSPRRKRGASEAVRVRPPRLDPGTRRAPRWKMPAGVTVGIDHEAARVVDLSILGAQITTPRTLRPGQQVDLRFEASGGGFAVTADVIWAKLELVRSRPVYRAGLHFRNADARQVTAFATAHADIKK
ncbi:MAG TPA: PilZ domain-containing protein [Vicinamibacterales bacterium]|nr:PilZ domain-containing protein [Vicinamibacterales bacterium]